MVQSTSKSADVSNDSSAHNENGLVSRNAMFFQVNQDLLNIANLLVHFIALVNQGLVVDSVVLKVGLQILAIDALHLVIHDGDAPAEHLVDAGQGVIVEVEHLVADLDGGRQGGAHDALDGRAVLGGHRVSVALAVDVGGIHGVRVFRFHFVSKIIVVFNAIVLKVPKYH